LPLDSAAGGALFGDGCGVAGFADELVVGVSEDLLGFGFEVAWSGEEEGGSLRACSSVP
jgi:hypothetical protein